MKKFLPFYPVVLAFAQELQRRSQEDPQSTLQGVVQAMLDERPNLNVSETTPLTSQMNDLMRLAEPGSDDLRLALMVFLPGRRGCLFTMQDIPVVEVQQFKSSPIQQVGGSLAAALDQNWNEVLQVVETIPVPQPLRIVGANGLPPETHHRSAQGPQPSDIEKFLRP